MRAGPGTGWSGATFAVRTDVPSTGLVELVISAGLSANALVIAARTSDSVMPKRTSRKPVTSYFACAAGSGFAAEAGEVRLVRRPSTPASRRSVRQFRAISSIRKKEGAFRTNAASNDLHDGKSKPGLESLE